MEPNETTQLLKAIPLTNVEIATALGVSKEIVSRWRGGANISKGNIAKLRYLLAQHHGEIPNDAERHADVLRQPLSPSEEIKNAAIMRAAGDMTEEEFVRFKAALLGQMERDGERKP